MSDRHTGHSNSVVRCHTAIFLVSDLPNFITRRDIVIDGGMGMGNDWQTYTRWAPSSAAASAGDTTDIWNRNPNIWDAAP